MSFRAWCQEMWYQHVDECLTWEGVAPAGTSQEYFAKYKFWLKREYRHSQRQAQGN